MHRLRPRPFGAVAALALLVAGCGLTTAPVARPSPGASAAVAPSVAASATTSVPTPVGGDPTPVPTASGEADGVGGAVAPEFTPPQPLCLGQPLEVHPPAVRARVGDHTVPATMGSASVQTCTTASVEDVVGDQQLAGPLEVTSDDDLVFSVDRGWRILWFEEHDSEKGADETNVTPGVRTLDAPGEVTVPVPARTGDVVVGLTIWVVRDDGMAVAQITPTVWIRVEGP